MVGLIKKAGVTAVKQYVLKEEEMKQLDRLAMEVYQMPGILLMERAGLVVVEEIVKTHKEKGPVIILCGGGNNGGDGFVIGRELYNRGYKVEVICSVPLDTIKGDAKVHLEIIKQLPIAITVISQDTQWPEMINKLKQSSLLVDALLGTGLKGGLKPVLKQLIEIMNASGKPVVSVDIPSGVRAADGQIQEVAVRAEKTVTFQLPKLGNIMYPGAAFGGRLVVKDIGIPREAIDQFTYQHELIDMGNLSIFSRPREADTHKGTYGSGLIIAGSLGMTGAAALSARSALRTGAGLIRLGVPESLCGIVATMVAEAITVPLRESKKGFLGIADIDKILELMQKSKVVALGPGCGQREELQDLLRNVLEKSQMPVVIDADGLNALAKKVSMLKTANCPVVLTPHPMEFSRLSQLPMEVIKGQPIDVARDFAQKWQVILVLKGARTIVADPDGKIYINTTGNPGMATAGSGDVLTGMIVGLIAQGVTALEAAQGAVWLHGRAGDLAAANLGEAGMIAGDLIDQLPLAIKALNGSI